MNFKAILKAFCIHTCIYTTVAFSAISLFLLAVGMTSFALASFLLILAYCACLALANVIFAHTKLSIWWRSALHAILTLGGFYLCIYIRYADIGTPSETLSLVLVLVSLLYGISFGVFLAIRQARHRKSEQKAYQSLYSPNKDQKRR